MEELKIIFESSYEVWFHALTPLNPGFAKVSYRLRQMDGVWVLAKGDSPLESWQSKKPLAEQVGKAVAIIVNRQRV